MALRHQLRIHPSLPAVRGRRLTAAVLLGFGAAACLRGAQPAKTEATWHGMTVRVEEPYSISPKGSGLMIRSRVRNAETNPGLALVGLTPKLVDTLEFQKRKCAGQPLPCDLRQQVAGSTWYECVQAGGVPFKGHHELVTFCRVPSLKIGAFYVCEGEECNRFAAILDSALSTAPASPETSKPTSDSGAA